MGAHLVSKCSSKSSESYAWALRQQQMLNAKTVRLSLWICKQSLVWYTIVTIIGSCWIHHWILLDPVGVVCYTHLFSSTNRYGNRRDIYARRIIIFWTSSCDPSLLGLTLWLRTLGWSDDYDSFTVRTMIPGEFPFCLDSLSTKHAKDTRRNPVSMLIEQVVYIPCLAGKTHISPKVPELFMAITMWAHPVISWFINPTNYCSYRHHETRLLKLSTRPHIVPIIEPDFFLDSSPTYPICCG